ncbi:hypothetical protein MIC448_410009 [Microbacterium sp. C448]|nr:hypothetical protein MIC448_410009 [Microbacterium sp. C448]
MSASVFMRPPYEVALVPSTGSAFGMVGWVRSAGSGSGGRLRDRGEAQRPARYDSA